MKLVAVLGSLLFSFAANACPDFTGQYEDAPFKTQNLFEFKQTGCQQVDWFHYTVDAKDSKKTLVQTTQWLTDGEERAVQDPLDENVIHYTTAKFEGDVLKIQRKIFDKFRNQIAGHDESKIYAQATSLMRTYVRRDNLGNQAEAYTVRYVRAGKTVSEPIFDIQRGDSFTCHINVYRSAKDVRDIYYMTGVVGKLEDPSYDVLKLQSITTYTFYTAFILSAAAAEVDSRTGKKKESRLSLEVRALNRTDDSQHLTKTKRVDFKIVERDFSKPFSVAIDVEETDEDPKARKVEAVCVGFRR